MNLRIFDNIPDLNRATARTIAESAVDSSVIALSGGNSPIPVYEMLGRDDALRERRVTWVVVDERYVPESDPQSNSAMIERTLFARGIPPSHRFLRFQTDLGDPAATAREFESEWFSLGIDRIDLCVLGIGDEGHTASLFPGTTALDVDDRIAVENWVPKVNMWRLTLTAPVIRNAIVRLVQAAGETKRPIVTGVREGTDFPITRVTQGVETWWLIDRAAAPVS